MIATLDGRITIGGRSGPIGGPADRELFHDLREQADAVMAGAGTCATSATAGWCATPSDAPGASRRGSTRILSRSW